MLGGAVPVSGTVTDCAEGESGLMAGTGEEFDACNSEPKLIAFRIV
jgi:hypothetical protein